jgi:hypothetical protein
MNFISKVILQLTFMIIILIIGVIFSKRMNFDDNYNKTFFWWLILLTGFVIQTTWANYWYVTSVRNKEGPEGIQGEIGPPGPQGPPGVCKCPSS